MGLWDAICSVGSSIVSGVKSVCSAIGSACSSIGGAVASGIGTLAQKILELPVKPTIVDAIISLVKVVAELLMDSPKDEKVEDLGAAMKQAEKKPEDFDSINDYIDYLREEIKKGSVKLGQSEGIELFSEKMMGVALLSEGLGEKYGMKPSAEFWGEMGKKVHDGKLEPKEVGSIIQKASQAEVQLDNVSNYLKGEEVKGNKKSEVSSVIIDGLKESNPSLSDLEIDKRFNELIKQ